MQTSLMSDDQWAAFRAAYPRRSGTQRWPAARRFAEKLLDDDDVSVEELIKSAERYALFAQRTKIWGTCYVLQAATFLNSAGGWMEAWEVSSPVPVPTPVPEAPRPEPTAEEKELASAAREKIRDLARRLSRA